MRALAANGTFARFDHLSTVSGGGYAGSAVGRLYGGNGSAQQVQAGLARRDTLFLWWLRSNGRYLTPAGAKDMMQAAASILRGILSTHFEVGMLLLLVAGMMLLPYRVLEAFTTDAWYAAFHANAVSLWLWALALPVVLGGHNIFGYVFARTKRTPLATTVDAIGAVACFVIGFRWAEEVLRELQPGPLRTMLPPALSGVACLLLMTPASAGLWRWYRQARGQQEVVAARLSHTKGLASALWIAGLFIMIGLVDWISWAVANYWAAGPAATPWSAVIVALPAPLVAVVRLALPKIQKWMDKAKDDPVKTRASLNLAGIALLLLVVLAWATAFQFFGGPLRWNWLEDGGARPLDPEEVRGWKWLVLTGVPLLYVAATAGNVEMLNLSSLHNFYRARIERAYVGSGNAARFGMKGALEQADRPSTEKACSLREAVDGDDVALSQYRPHAHGGPIHLINCCINQTVDDRTQNYNADRKGVALTVSSFGAETGSQLPPTAAPAVPGMLSRWIAISGAAASSGMGSETSPGLAALLFLSGLRLGYWQENLGAHGGGAARRAFRPQMLRDEGLARFPGLRDGQWYVSDGGHFDNTGVYALLKRTPDLIVAADCGADPEYSFGDVENLVRKAQIDYQADIVFVKPEVLAADRPHEALHARIALPADIRAEAGAPYLLLGRILYAGGAKGTLIVVKPRSVPDLTLDIVSYGKRNAPFPQQPTGDQFFDEEQWEAYHQLGVFLGGPLTEQNIELLRTWAWR